MANLSSAAPPLPPSEAPGSRRGPWLSALQSVATRRSTRPARLPACSGLRSLGLRAGPVHTWTRRRSGARPWSPLASPLDPPACSGLRSLGLRRTPRALVSRALVSGPGSHEDAEERLRRRSGARPWSPTPLAVVVFSARRPRRVVRGLGRAFLYMLYLYLSLRAGLRLGYPKYAL